MDRAVRTSHLGSTRVGTCNPHMTLSSNTHFAGVKFRPENFKNLFLEGNSNFSITKYGEDTFLAHMELFSCNAK